MVVSRHPAVRSGSGWRFVVGEYGNSRPAESPANVHDFTRISASLI
jgi:hypothetical protein